MEVERRAGRWAVPWQWSTLPTSFWFGREEVAVGLRPRFGWQTLLLLLRLFRLLRLHCRLCYVLRDQVLLMEVVGG